MKPEQLVIGTRGSALALAQVEIVKKHLLKAHPNLDVRIEVIVTEGDQNQAPIPLDQVGKGWFTKEIEQALLDGVIDLAVHSLKDLADVMPPGLSIGAYLSREDARDALITTGGEALALLPPSPVIGTDSLRRQVQIHALRPDAVVKSIRGNVQTRLKKLETEAYDGIVLAVAGLKRLGLEDRIAQIFEVDEMTPAPGQGILALQIREDDAARVALLKAIADPELAHAAHIERSFSRMLGGGCKSPTGAYAYREGDEWVCTGMHTHMKEERTVRLTLRAPEANALTLGEELAKRVLEN